MIKSYERLKKLNKEKLRIPRTVQDTIPVDTIYKDGIFKSGNKYTKSYRISTTRLLLEKIKIISF